MRCRHTLSRLSAGMLGMYRQCLTLQNAGRDGILVFMPIVLHRGKWKSLASFKENLRLSGWIKWVQEHKSTGAFTQISPEPAIRLAKSYIMYMKQRKCQPLLLHRFAWGHKWDKMQKLTDKHEVLYKQNFFSRYITVREPKWGKLQNKIECHFTSSS